MPDLPPPPPPPPWILLVAALLLVLPAPGTTAALAKVAAISPIQVEEDNKPASPSPAVPQKIVMTATTDPEGREDQDPQPIRSSTPPTPSAASITNTTATTKRRPKSKARPKPKARRKPRIRLIKVYKKVWRSPKRKKGPRFPKQENVSQPATTVPSRPPSSIQSSMKLVMKPVTETDENSMRTEKSPVLAGESSDSDKNGGDDKIQVNVPQNQFMINENKADGDSSPSEKSPVPTDESMESDKSEENDRTQVSAAQSYFMANEDEAGRDSALSEKSPVPTDQSTESDKSEENDRTQVSAAQSHFMANEDEAGRDSALSGKSSVSTDESRESDRSEDNDQTQVNALQSHFMANEDEAGRDSALSGKSSVSTDESTESDKSGDNDQTQENIPQNHFMTNEDEAGRDSALSEKSSASADESTDSNDIGDNDKIQVNALEINEDEIDENSALSEESPSSASESTDGNKSEGNDETQVNTSQSQLMKNENEEQRENFDNEALQKSTMQLPLDSEQRESPPTSDTQIYDGRKSPQAVTSDDNAERDRQRLLNDSKSHQQEAITEVDTKYSASTVGNPALYTKTNENLAERFLDVTIGQIETLAQNTPDPRGRKENKNYEDSIDATEPLPQDDGHKFDGSEITTLMQDINSVTETQIGSVPDDERGRLSSTSTSTSSGRDSQNVTLSTDNHVSAVSSVYSPSLSMRESIKEESSKSVDFRGTFDLSSKTTLEGVTENTELSPISESNMGSHEQDKEETSSKNYSQKIVSSTDISEDVGYYSQSVAERTSLQSFSEPPYNTAHQQSEQLEKELTSNREFQYTIMPSTSGNSLEKSDTLLDKSNISNYSDWNITTEKVLNFITTPHFVLELNAETRKNTSYPEMFENHVLLADEHGKFKKIREPISTRHHLQSDQNKSFNYKTIVQPFLHRETLHISPTVSPSHHMLWPGSSNDPISISAVTDSTTTPTTKSFYIPTNTGALVQKPQNNKKYTSQEDSPDRRNIARGEMKRIPGSTPSSGIDCYRTLLQASSFGTSNSKSALNAEEKIPAYTKYRNQGWSNTPLNNRPLSRYFLEKRPVWKNHLSNLEYAEYLIRKLFATQSVDLPARSQTTWSPPDTSRISVHEKCPVPNYLSSSILCQWAIPINWNLCLPSMRPVPNYHNDAFYRYLLDPPIRWSDKASAHQMHGLLPSSAARDLSSRPTSKLTPGSFPTPLPAPVFFFPLSSPDFMEDDVPDSEYEKLLEDIENRQDYLFTFEDDFDLDYEYDGEEVLDEMLLDDNIGRRVAVLPLDSTRANAELSRRGTGLPEGARIVLGRSQVRLAPPPVLRPVSRPDPATVSVSAPTLQDPTATAFWTGLRPLRPWEPLLPPQQTVNQESPCIHQLRLWYERAQMPPQSRRQPYPAFYEHPLDYNG